MPAKMRRARVVWRGARLTAEPPPLFQDAEFFGKIFFRKNRIYARVVVSAILPAKGKGGGQPRAVLSAPGPQDSAKSEKSLRETLSPLKSFKTAKSGNFRPKGYQRLSKAHDFAGETISFRFRLFFVSRERKIPFWDRRVAAVGGVENLEDPPITRNKLFSRPNPLKRNKTTKEMFAKICRKQTFIWRNLRKKLGPPRWRRRRPRRPSSGCQTRAIH